MFPAGNNRPGQPTASGQAPGRCAWYSARIGNPPGDEPPTCVVSAMSWPRALNPCFMSSPRRRSPRSAAHQPPDTQRDATGDHTQRLPSAPTEVAAQQALFAAATDQPAQSPALQTLGDGAAPGRLPSSTMRPGGQARLVCKACRITTPPRLWPTRCKLVPQDLPYPVGRRGHCPGRPAQGPVVEQPRPVAATAQPPRQQHQFQPAHPGYRERVRRFRALSRYPVSCRDDAAARDTASVDWYKPQQRFPVGPGSGQPGGRRARQPAIGAVFVRIQPHRRSAAHSTRNTCSRLVAASGA